MNDVWCVLGAKCDENEVRKAIKMSIHIFTDVHFQMSSPWQVSEFQAIQFVEMWHTNEME